MALVMPVTAPRPTPWATLRALVPRLARCAWVSGVTTTISMAVLAVGMGPLAMAPAAANAVATAVATGPSYALNRRWVWGLRGPSDLRRQVLPFWGMSFAGLVLSSLAVGASAAWADTTTLSGAGRAVALAAANISAWGLLWVVQFVVLERWLFRTRP